VSKYFYGKVGSPDRETSVRHLIGRVVDTITDWGVHQHYFKTVQDAANFRDDLTHLSLTQKACFNSPVWFNVGVKEPRGYGWYYDDATNGIKKLEPGERRPQCSACFINSVGDTLESILDLAKTEGMLFKWGSGSHEPFELARGRRNSIGRRTRLRAAELHEGLRRVCGRDQERRQNTAGGQDGDPERGPSGHRIVHLVQGERREEGADAD
jgi:ribonucleoside-diphosphate reductase alpha chain